MNQGMNHGSSPESPARASTGEPAGCALCALRSRRLFTRWLAAAPLLPMSGPTWAQGDPGGVQREVGKNSRWTKLVPAEDLEASAAQQYQQLTGEARAQRALAGDSHPQVIRLRAIAGSIVPFAPPWNERAKRWKWEVNLLGSKEMNAFCMPGGKIAFYMGILQTLQLNDDEVAAIMGHEVAHALREHARERLAKQLATQGAVGLGAALLGLGDAGRLAADLGARLLSLKFSRDDETDADIVGMDLAARSGFDPAAGVSLWQKMLAASKGAPPKWLSTHPSGEQRINEIRARLPRVQPLFEAAPRPPRRFAPPAA